MTEKCRKEVDEALRLQSCLDYFFTYPLIVDSGIEIINSGEPDIIDSKVSYREERKVN